MIVIEPTYENLREWLEFMPQTFFQQGKVIYDARNQIRVVTAPDGKQYNVKRYCAPKWFNRIVYTLFRQPKAKRAYQNALILQSKNIPTPHPVAYILCGQRWLEESFLITEQSPLPHMLYELGDGRIEGREQVIHDLGVFAAQMHEKGVLHLDFSPGNVLFNEVKGRTIFTIVDINRMRFGQVGKKEGCENFARLWGGRALYRILAPSYAEVRGIDSTQCHEWMWNAHARFWKGKKIPKSSFPVVLE